MDSLPEREADRLINGDLHRQSGIEALGKDYYLRVFTVDWLRVKRSDVAIWLDRKSTPPTISRRRTAISHRKRRPYFRDRSNAYTLGATQTVVYAGTTPVVTSLLLSATSASNL